MMVNDYPLVTETGETFLTNGQLCRFIREKCGDAVGEFVESALEVKKTGEGIMQRLNRVLDLLGNIDLSEVEIAVGKVQSIVEEMVK